VSVLVVVAANRIGARWVKAFGDAVVSCDAPQAAREIAAFARAEAARQQVELERGVAEALAERIGPQLQLLRMEIAKLALLADRARGEPRARRRRHGTRGRGADLDLTDAIGEDAPPMRCACSRACSLRVRRAGAAGRVCPTSGASCAWRRARRGAPPFVRKKLASQAKRMARPGCAPRSARCTRPTSR